LIRRWFGFGILSGLLVAGLGAAAVAASPSVAGTAEAASIEAPAAPERGALHLGIRDEAAMVLVGTILIGLAGAVRRAA
jgi:hypothetical protein